MSNAIVTTAFKTQVWTGVADVDTDVFNAVLLMGTSALADNTIKAWNSYSNVSAYEVSGAGYTAFGVQLTNVIETSSTGNASIRKWTADNISWPSSSFTSDAVAIIDTSASDLVVCYLPFGANKQAIAGTFFLNWPSNGIINLQ